MKESEDGGRWGRGIKEKVWRAVTLPRKAGPFLKAGFRLFLTPLIPGSEEAKTQTNAPVLDFLGTPEDFGR